jgi:flavin-dependent dehydrogenase
MRDVDVAIIGGSLAGAACVRTLAAAGIDAIAIERDRFPREKVCGGFLSPGAVEAIEELGLLDELRRAGAIEVRSAHVRSAGTEAHVAFRRPGLGISRRALDAVLGDHDAVEQGNVTTVNQDPDGRFQIEWSSGDAIRARVLIDAAGKLSRFGKLDSTPQFGVQFYEPGNRGDSMEFWFFADGYGGTVGIEDGRSNSCFLIGSDALPRYLGKPGCRVTGPVAYRSRHSEFLAIGDAAGMIDPFCGEGMHHALDTGKIAAASVICGLERSWTYAEIRRHYEGERNRRWARKRALARAARYVLQSPRLRNVGLRLNLEGLMTWFWG